MARFKGKEILLVGLKGEKGDKGDKGDSANLSDYVKNTDYAEEYNSSTDSGKYGIVRPANGLHIDNRNNLTTDRTTTGVNNNQYVWTKEKFIEEINKGNSNTAVTVGTLGVAVKSALLNPGNFKANGAQGNYPTTWTKDEQELAQKTLGITNSGGGISIDDIATNEDIESILGSNSYINELKEQANQIIDEQEELIGGE